MGCVQEKTPKPEAEEWVTVIGGNVLVCGIKTPRPPHTSALELICQHNYKANGANPTGRHRKGFAQRRTKLTSNEWMILAPRQNGEELSKPPEQKHTKEPPAGLQLAGFAPTFPPLGSESWAERGVLLSPLGGAHWLEEHQVQKTYPRPPKQKRQDKLQHRGVRIRA